MSFLSYGPECSMSQFMFFNVTFNQGGIFVANRTKINFEGAGVVVADDPTNSQVVVTIAGGGGGAGWTRDASGVVYLTTNTDVGVFGALGDVVAGRKLTVRETGVNEGIRVTSDVAASNVFDALVAGEAFPRISWIADGTLLLGDGTAAPNAGLRWGAANVLELPTGDTLRPQTTLQDLGDTTHLWDLFGGTLRSTGGRWRTPTVVTTTPYTILDTDELIYIDATAGNLVLNLPTLAANAQLGRRIVFVRLDETTNTVTIMPTGTQTIAGQTAARVYTVNQNTLELEGGPSGGTGADNWSIIPAVVPDSAYGSGSDGDFVLDGTTAITLRGNLITPAAGVYTFPCNMDARIVKVTATGVRLALAGWVLRAHQFHQVSGHTCTVSDNGNAASGSTAGAGLSATGISSLRTSGAGAAGRTVAGNGNNGSGQTSTSMGGDGGDGGVSGDGNTGGTGGNAQFIAASTAGYPQDINTTMTGLSYQQTGWKGGGGGGSGAKGAAGIGNSGAGGGGGGVVFCYLSAISNLGATLVLEANGGAGATAPGTSLVGGGGGGGGGYVQLFYHTATGTLTLQALPGAPGAGVGGGGTGVIGATGNTLMVRY